MSATFMTRRFATTLMTLLAVGAAAACGAPATDPQPESTAEREVPAAAAPASARVEDEAVRVQKFLDERYTAADVRHSFTTKLGEAIDCVDFFAQPGVKALAARGMPMTEMPHFDIPADVQARLPAKAATHAPEDLSFNGALDDDGNARECPDGSVPTVRITAERIAAAGGLDKFRGFGSRKKVAPRIKAPGLPEFQGYGHVQTSFDGVHAIGGISTMTIATPTLPANAASYYDHSLVQTWTFSGTEEGPGCGSNCFQTVEAGWGVDPYQFGDTSPHLFIFGTPDGYVTGCYDNESWTGTCMPWIPIAGAKFALGQKITSTSVAGGTQAELTVYTLDGAPGAWPGWVITVDIAGTATVLGYYPMTGYENGQMTKYATDFQVGGEVYDGLADSTGTWLDPPTVPMGMGGLGGLFLFDQGYTWTAVQHDYSYFSGSAWIYSAPAPISTRTGSYTFNTADAKGSTSWQNYFYFGDVIPFRIIRL